ncbi:MAG: CPBP family intramembrane metalloprotease [Clostridia bacterium]|nr:CPBP family intramembrane metalloprotease [Clostridia bacterium]
MDYNQNNNQNSNQYNSQGFNQYGNYQPQGYNHNNMNGQYNPYGQNSYYGAQPNFIPNYQQPTFQQPMNYPYGMRNNQQNYIISQQRFLRLREQKNEIKKFSTTFAIAMLGFLIASYAISVILMFGDLMSLYENNGTFSASVGVFYSLAAVGIPFLIANKVLAKNKLQHETASTIYSAPKFSLKTVCLIFLSVLGCVVSMYVTGIVSVFFSIFGFEVSAGGEPSINGIVDIIALFFGTAIIPPLVEEFAMRNVLMQTLRKYGNLFAILASAFAFGIFHGTPTQIPFAFLCGLFIGYAVIATESIWTGVIIHAIVNGLSCVYYGASYFTDEDTGDSIYSLITSVLAILGVIALIIYIAKFKDEFRRIINIKGLDDYSTGEKLKKFIFTPMMILAIIVFFYQAITCITPATGVTT